ncbi:GGDEF domain-containing protein [Castellaniella sp.]|uniref:GGDEF domain-containing protein n=1 Tax=Castellaniella sp. TaxID=1955812 RepID=UPI002AFF3A79|nr:GGDEF domain-containing protein [Castellaniella sp.]
MGRLDPRTLLIAEIPILLLVGGLILAATLLGRRDRTLGWTGAALLLIGAGFLLGVADPGGAWRRSVTSFGALLILAHACVWTGLRAFSGKPPLWPWIAAGPLAWCLVCLWPGFVFSSAARVVAYGLPTLAYTGASLWELGFGPRGKGNTRLAVLPSGILLLHGLLTAARMAVVSLSGSEPGRLRFDFPMAVFEGMLFFIGVAFAVLMMVGARSERRYRHAALHDALTDLANRRALYERGGSMLRESLAQGRTVALLMCDLDRFKRINDSCGHEAGDRVLAAFAGVLRRAVRKGDLCARIGGEEFVILAPDMDAEGALGLAERIRDHLRECDCRICEPLSASIGIVCAPQGGNELGLLLARADRAMYQAKDAGRDCARLWTGDPEGDASAAVAGGGRGRAGQHPVDA